MGCRQSHSGTVLPCLGSSQHEDGSLALPRFVHFRYNKAICAAQKKAHMELFKSYELREETVKWNTIYSTLTTYLPNDLEEQFQIKNSWTPGNSALEWGISGNNDSRSPHLSLLLFLLLAFSEGPHGQACGCSSLSSNLCPQLLQTAAWDYLLEAGISPRQWGGLWEDGPGERSYNVLEAGSGRAI